MLLAIEQLSVTVNCTNCKIASDGVASTQDSRPVKAVVRLSQLEAKIGVSPALLLNIGTALVDPCCRYSSSTR